MLIYCITNMINGKKYIGQTQNSFNERWYHHTHNRQANLGKKRTEESKRKQSESTRGVPYSEERKLKQRMKESQKERWRIRKSAGTL